MLLYVKMVLSSENQKITIQYPKVIFLKYNFFKIFLKLGYILAEFNSIFNLLLFFGIISKLISQDEIYIKISKTLLKHYYCVKNKVVP